MGFFLASRQVTAEKLGHSGLTPMTKQEVVGSEEALFNKPHKKISLSEDDERELDKEWEAIME